jgi:YihY family inner membrane protein
VSTASYVPPVDPNREGVREAVRAATTRELVVDSFIRFRKADGFSFARSIAFQMVFSILPGAILVVAIAVRLGEGRLQGLIRDGITTLAPGPASDMLLQAFEQGADAAGTGNLLAIALGGIVAVVAAVTGVAQLQRGASRIYGIQDDRTTVKRYTLATLLTLTYGLAMTAVFILIVLGTSVGGALQDQLAQTWAWARWPIGMALLLVALMIAFKISPNRHQPPFEWLILGGAVAALGWLAVSIGTAYYLNASAIFGETYGPLAGFMGLILWTQLSSIAILYGLAVAAQIEALAAGVDEPTEEAEHADDPAGVMA